jgi:hypothetical protein
VVLDPQRALGAACMLRDLPLKLDRGLDLVGSSLRSFLPIPIHFAANPSFVRHTDPRRLVTDITIAIMQPEKMGEECLRTPFMEIQLNPILGTNKLHSMYLRRG